MSKVIFFGNSKYSVIGAEIIHKEFPISLVVTIPDKSIGRKKILTPSPTKIWAQKNNIEALETDKLDTVAQEKIKKISPDFFVIEDYGLILPETILNLPKFASINIHHSLLPKYRGSSPAPAAIYYGDKITGVTIIEITSKMDAGDILAQAKYKMKDHETADSLLIQLNILGAALIPDVLKTYQSKTLKKVKQDDSQASYTWKKAETKDKAYFDIENPPSLEAIDRMARAFYPWPNAWTKWNGKIIKFYPNKMVQLEGKKPVTYKQFKEGYPNFPLELN